MENTKSNKKHKPLEFKDIIFIIETLFFPAGIVLARKLNPWPLFSKLAFVALPLVGAIYILLRYLNRKDTSKLALLAYGILPIIYAIAIIIKA